MNTFLFDCTYGDNDIFSLGARSGMQIVWICTSIALGFVLLMLDNRFYDVVLNTDAKEFGGNGLADDTITHLTNYDPAYVSEHKEWLKLYIPARSAVVLKKN